MGAERKRKRSMRSVIGRGQLFWGRIGRCGVGEMKEGGGIKGKKEFFHIPPRFLGFVNRPLWFLYV